MHIESQTMENVEESLQQLLNKTASDQKYENHEITINEVSTGGANYTSKLFAVIIREANKEDLHLFAKVAAYGDRYRNDVHIDLYKREEFAYTTLAKIYASLQENNRVPEEHRLYFSRLYGFNPDIYQETLIFENLLVRGYVPHNRFQSINWEFASSAVAELAKMHALSFAFSKQYPEEFEKALVRLKLKLEESRSMNLALQKMIGFALKKVKPKYIQAFQKFMESQKNPLKMLAPIRSKVIVHGDFKGDNLLHKVQEVSLYITYFFRNTNLIIPRYILQQKQLRF